MSPRRIKIISLIIFFLLTGIYALFTLSKEAERTPTLQPQISDKPNFPENTKTNLPISIQEDVNPQIPDSLTLISFNLKEININESREISRKLGFSGNEIEINDFLEGVKYVWSNNTNYLWITPQKSQIRFGMSRFPEIILNRQLSEDVVINQALDFVVNNFNINRNEISFSSISYYKTSKILESGFTGSTRDEAQIIHINLTYNNVNFPILTSISRYQIMFVEILTNGQVYKAEAYLADSFKPSGEELKLKTIEEINQSLNEAHLISLENDYIDINDIRPVDITNINIHEIITGYYFDNESLIKTLYPIFLLEGDISIKNSTADKAKLYINALK